MGLGGLGGLPAEVVAKARAKPVGVAKTVEWSRISNGFTLADPDDCGMLDVVGFDATVPVLIADFNRQ